jgi:hypothetical protein
MPAKRKYFVPVLCKARNHRWISKFIIENCLFVVTVRQINASQYVEGKQWGEGLGE